MFGKSPFPDRSSRPGAAQSSFGRVIHSFAPFYSVLVIPLTTNMDRARLAGTAVVSSTDLGPVSNPKRDAA
jgi:hypothetical protein